MKTTNLDAVELGRSFAQLARPQNTRLSLLLFVAMAVKLHVLLPHIVFGAILIVLVYATVTAYNDQQDLEADKENDRNLPLVSGKLNNFQVNIFLGVTSALALLAQFFVGQPAGIIFTLTYLGLGWVYSRPPFSFSHRGLWGTLLLSICYSGLPIYLAIFQTSAPQAKNLDILLVAIPFSMASLLFKDYKDKKGDLKVGKLTPLVRYGSRNIKLIAWVLTILGGLAAALVQPFAGIWLMGYASMLVSLIMMSRQQVPNPALVRVYSYSALMLAISLMYFGRY